jgi:hypothetical protein
MEPQRLRWFDPSVAQNVPEVNFPSQPPGSGGGRLSAPCGKRPSVQVSAQVLDLQTLGKWIEQKRCRNGSRFRYLKAKQHERNQGETSGNDWTAPGWQGKMKRGQNWEPDEKKSDASDRFG